MTCVRSGRWPADVEIVRDVLAIVGGLCVLCTVLILIWIAIAGQRDGEMG